LSTIGSHAQAQALPPEEIERRAREAREARERDAELAQPDVHPDVARIYDQHQLTLPDESPCFPIARLTLGGPRLDEFAWIQRYLNRYTGRCIGAQGVGLIARRVGDLIIDRGFVTSRVGVPAQNLAEGTLRLELVPGVLRAVRLEGDAVGRWQTALSLRPGDLINLRAIEQAVEQFKRLPSQDVTIDIAPAEQAGESDLVIQARRGRRWRISGSADDTGSEPTGRVQGGLQAGWDNVLGVNDLVNVGWQRSLLSTAQGASVSRNVGYGLPLGRWNLDLDTSAYRYHQSVDGADLSFRSSGRSSTSGVTLARALHRAQRATSVMDLRIDQRHSRSFIGDLELANQRRETTGAVLSVRHRHTLGPGRVDARVAGKFGVPWLGGQGDAPGTPSAYPTYEYRIATFDVSWDQALPWAALQWRSELRGQHTDATLYGSEQFAVGSRFSVRGFSGEQPLTGERGALWRNTVTWPATGALALYGGVDVGQVAGPSTVYLAGQRLSGAVVGVRGSAGAASFDFFAGHGLSAPRGLDQSTVFGAQLTFSL
jgi:hemolysin activation/secretion protein